MTSMSLPEPTTAEREHARGVRASTEKSARGAFKFYRIAGIVTGVWLLLLTLELILKYVVNVNGDHSAVIGSWVAISHGVIYVVYLASCFHLWATMKWSLPRLIYMALAGVIPFMSFVLEVVAKKWFDADLPGLLDRAEARDLRRSQIKRLKESRS